MPQQFGAFGSSVALSDDTALVGAITGVSAYFFARTGGIWTEVKKVSGALGFGCSVDLSGDTAVIGVLRDSTAGTWAGAAIVFAQLWYRDPLSSGKTSFSDALAFFVEP